MKTINTQAFCKSSTSGSLQLVVAAFRIVMWIFSAPPQSTSCTALEMPTSAKVLQVILEYIYTDESPTIRGIRLHCFKDLF